MLEVLPAQFVFKGQKKSTMYEYTTGNHRPLIEGQKKSTMYEYTTGNHRPLIEGPIMQWQKEKGSKRQIKNIL
jgi:hypothetical protein